MDFQATLFGGPPPARFAPARSPGLARSPGPAPSAASSVGAALAGGEHPETAAPRPLAGVVERTPLAHGAWVDVRRDWLAGADEVFATLLTAIPWRAERRRMYDRVVDVPRLVHTYAVGEPLPHPALAACRDLLSGYYAGQGGEPFVTAGCCFYRDGNDSVAWHGDRIGRGRTSDTMVAILSVGDPRRLALRPDGGGASLAFTMGHGDLLVMGGSCQRTWEHAVPKTASAGPRISVQFRPLDVF